MGDDITSQLLEQLERRRQESLHVIFKDSERNGQGGMLELRIGLITTKEHSDRSGLTDLQTWA